MAVNGASLILGAGYSKYRIQFAAEKVKILKRNGFFNVNKTLLPAKLFYFLFMGSMVSFIPFVPVYMEQLGLNGFQIGLLRTVQPVGTIIAGPLWGSLADKFGIHRKVVIAGIVCGGPVTFATYFTPSSVHAPDNVTLATTQPPPFSWDSTYITFSVIFALSVLSISSFAHVNPTVDSNVMQLLKDFPQTDYGKQRLWGAVGWGSISALTGLAMDTYIKHVPGGNRFLPAYIMFAVLMAPSVIPISLMKFPSHTRPESISGGIFRLFKRFKIIVFFFIAGVCGLSLGVINTFQFLFLKELKAPSLLMGLTLTVTCLSEIPVMYLVGKVMSLTGEEIVFAAALACYGLRFFLYSILKNPWHILPIELLHGICFGALWPAMASYANKIAPLGMGATTQNLMSAASKGIGRTVGCVAGGYIYNTYGARTLFWMCGYLCAGTTVLLIVYVTIDALVARYRRRSLMSYSEI